MKNKVIGVVLVIIALGYGLWSWSSYEKAKSDDAIPASSDIVFFFGKGCLHCKDVEKFIADNKIDEKVAFESLEVWHNAENNNTLMQKAEECGIAEKEIGIPFLSAKGECFVGTVNIENFFKQEAGIK
jgi:hypothetical protein